MNQGAKLMSRIHSPLAALPCRISRSAFPDERFFRIATFDGRDHVGIGPAHYFWDDQDKPIGSDVPGEGQEIEGLIAAQVLKVEAARALVEVPDGSVAWVAEKDIVPRPTEIDLHVSVRS
jgi:hypothetical protein